MLSAPRKYGVFDRTLLQVIENLIARWMSGAGNRGHFVQILDVEIADAPGANFALRGERLERGNGFLERHAPAPVEQVAIEPIGAQPGQRFLTSGHRALPGRV